MAAKLARFSWLPGGLAAALVIAAGRLVFSTSSAPAELELYDRVMQAAPVAPSPDVVIVAIDDASIARLGEWPWPRDVHAALLDRLTADDARVIAFTTPFGTSQHGGELGRVRAALALLESSDLGNSDHARQLRRLLAEAGTVRDPDAHLAQTIATHADVVLPAQSSNVLADAASAIGHLQFQADDDGAVRSDLAAMRVGGALLPSLATAIAARASGISPGELTFDESGSLRIGERTIPMDSDLTVRPHYFAPSGAESFAQYSYWQVLAGEIPPEQLRDKIVLIGFTSGAAPAPSAVATPVSNASPAVVTIASGVSSLITGTTYSRPAFAHVLEWGVGVGVVAFAAFALPAAGAAIGALATLLIIAILVVSEIGLLSSMHVWALLLLPCAAVSAGFVLYLVGELNRRVDARNDGGKDAGSKLRTLGQTFQRQGQLDLAFETYQRCALDAPTMELLYYLGMDFERRRQHQKAAAVYSHIATRDPNYRDLRTRRARVKEDPVATNTPRPAARPPAVSDIRRAESPASNPPAEPRTPARTLGRYEIERELGKGAMGIVYLGRDPKINRVVAIKAISLAEEFEESDLAEARARFFREAEMAGRLNHPGIVTVYDAGEDQGLAYIAMEYLRGQHLSHYTDSSRLLPPNTVMLLAARVADALHYAHRQNVVHRDIKPANIMFDPDTDELKMTDFGIARLTDTSRTKTGIVLGTPSFMSPEQLEGRTLDGRSDQFALGVSLYQLLSGQLPFRAESMPRLMHKIATEPHASVRLIRPELPERIEPIMQRVLAKSAQDRYADCSELAAALRSCAGPQPQAQPAEPRHEWLIP